jgi:hypothetical protein
MRQDDKPDGAQDGVEAAASDAIEPFMRARRDALRSGKRTGRTIKPRSE